jgi:hypothetical protein
LLSFHPTESFNNQSEGSRRRKAEAFDDVKFWWIAFDLD